LTNPELPEPSGRNMLTYGPQVAFQEAFNAPVILDKSATDETIVYWMTV